jgi:hypothetical protein
VFIDKFDAFEGELLDGDVLEGRGGTNNVSAVV